MYAIMQDTRTQIDSEPAKVKPEIGPGTTCVVPAHDRRPVESTYVEGTA